MSRKFAVGEKVYFFDRHIYKCDKGTIVDLTFESADYKDYVYIIDSNKNFLTTDHYVKEYYVREEYITKTKKELFTILLNLISNKIFKALQEIDALEEINEN